MKDVAFVFRTVLGKKLRRKRSILHLIGVQELEFLSKVNHFIDLVNRQYFYQDVAFGKRTLTLDGEGKITMPKVIRTVTRSTMIM